MSDFKTASSQQADAYLIKMNELKDGFAYEFIDRVVCDAVWNCSRFPSYNPLQIRIK